MKRQQKKINYKRQKAKQNRAAGIAVYCFCLLFLFLSACSDLQKPKTEPFYSETAPPQKKEFRWSNGKMPKSFDPALAAAPPETDIVRAIYEGLTDSNPKTLETIPAVAVDWSSSQDNKVWTFILRRDAKWSNGESVTAEDFVRSWKRLAEMGTQTAHYKLFGNIVGMRTKDEENVSSDEQNETDLFLKPAFNQNLPQIFKTPNPQTTVEQKTEGKPKSALNSAETAKDETTEAKKEEKNDSNKMTQAEPKTEFGVEAIDNYTLKVTLIKPDKDFPALVANPIFRPIYGDGKYFETNKLNANIITNGAFRVFSIGQDGVTLDRAENYWNSHQVELERVRFVPMENAEKALEAYRAGEIDAVTNADFEPLALKLLTPFDDFQRTTHSALNFYEINKNRAPFNDLRIRKALAMAIERERLTEDDMGGASRPALSFSPFEEDTKIKLTQDAEKAKNLFAEAGFADGKNFPVVRLVINRNNVQQRIARSVAKMWKDNLNIETEIVVKESDELNEIKKSGDYDVIRRGVVLPTTDETANMMTIFETEKPAEKQSDSANKADEKKLQAEKNTGEKIASGRTAMGKSLSETLLDETAPIEAAFNDNSDEAILTEDDAIFQLPAIPLYFPTSYSLVKPYIQGFEINTLDAPSLKNVRIDNNWQPKTTKSES